MAESRENVENAVAGDIIGVLRHRNLQVGDTLTVGKNKFEFEPLPTFTPEIFMKVSAKNVMKQKSLPQRNLGATSARRCYPALQELPDRRVYAGCRWTAPI